MYIQISLPFAPFSINKMFLRNRKYTVAARKYRFTVLKALQEKANAAKLKQIREAFNPLIHSFSITLISHYPTVTFFNKKGTISARTMDLTNTEKLLVDCFFSQKYTSKKWLLDRKGTEKSLYSPFKLLQNAGHDDRYVSDLKSLKRPTNASNPYQEVRVDIVPLRFLADFIHLLT